MSLLCFPCSKMVFDEVIELYWESDTQAVLLDRADPNTVSFNFNPRPSFASILSMLDTRRPRVRYQEPKSAKPHCATIHQSLQDMVQAFSPVVSSVQTCFVVGGLTWRGATTQVRRRMSSTTEPRLEFRLQVDNCTQSFVAWGHWATFVASINMDTIPCLAIFDVYRLPERDGSFVLLATNEK